MEMTNKLLLIAALICLAAGCVTEKDLQKMKRSNWIENDSGTLAPQEIVPEKEK
jgi:hypothetical protein